MSITLSTTCLAVVKLFLISLGGCLLVRLGLFSREAVTDLARLILYLPLPALVFITIFRRFNPTLILEAAVIPLSAILLTVLAGGLAWVGAFLSHVPPEHRSTYFAVLLFGNSGYIPIPLVMSILPEEKGEEAVALISLFILLFTPMLWSIGVYLVAHRKSPGISTKEGSKQSLYLRKMISPPLIGIVSGILCAVISPVKEFLHSGGKFLVESLSLLGQATVPLVMILLGTIMATISVSRSGESKGVSREKEDPKEGAGICFSGRLLFKFSGGVLFLRMLLLPAIVIPVLVLLPLPNMIKWIIAIESMVPPATNLVVIARNYGRPAELISLTILITYLCSLVTLPLLIHIITRLFPV